MARDAVGEIRGQRAQLRPSRRIELISGDLVGDPQSRTAVIARRRRTPRLPGGRPATRVRRPLRAAPRRPLRGTRCGPPAVAFRCRTSPAAIAGRLTVRSAQRAAPGGRATARPTRGRSGAVRPTPTSLGSGARSAAPGSRTAALCTARAAARAWFPDRCPVHGSRYCRARFPDRCPAQPAERRCAQLQVRPARPAVRRPAQLPACRSARPAGSRSVRLPGRPVPPAVRRPAQLAVRRSAQPAVRRPARPRGPALRSARGPLPRPASGLALRSARGPPLRPAPGSARGPPLCPAREPPPRPARGAWSPPGREESSAGPVRRRLEPASGRPRPTAGRPLDPRACLFPGLPGAPGCPGRGDAGLRPRPPRCSPGTFALQRNQ